jgi:hypothetical protein
MSAVDNVDMRLCRLEEALQLTQTQLLELSTQRQYDALQSLGRYIFGFFSSN